MTRLTTPDGTTYEVRTSGTGPTVLLIHGFTGRASDWTPFLQPLHRSGRRTIVVDLLGHGRSDAPADPGHHAIERQAIDITGILRSLGVASTVAVGARVALSLAVTDPNMVRGLILESPSAGIADHHERAARAAADAGLADQLERDGLAAFLETWEAAPPFAAERLLPAEAQDHIHAARLRNRAGALAASLRGAGQGSMEPLIDRLRSIRCPTLVIAGALNAVGIERARVVAQRIPSVRMLILPGIGHAPHREAPLRFRRLLIDQLATWSTS